jgi:geranylgeranyl diphosphate synthase, type II
MAPAVDASKVAAQLASYREQVLDELLRGLAAETGGRDHSLVCSYPSRPAKFLRPALCLATCAALGGEPTRALNSAVSIELFHNAFLIHDDLQDQSERRRGGFTLHLEHGMGMAVNAGNMTNLIALKRLFSNRWQLGPSLTWRIFQETELMMRHALEGQAIELGWIRDNRCDLIDADYYRMCLKKTSWYTCIYPCRVGALVAGATGQASYFDHYGWYLGAAFQIQDDVLNLVGEYERYGKEIAGDLWEGKRTLMLIDLLERLRGLDRRRAVRFLARSREERQAEDVEWIRTLIIDSGCVGRASAQSRQLADAAHAHAVRALDGLPESGARDFLLELPAYVLERDR